MTGFGTSENSVRSNEGHHAWRLVAPQMAFFEVTCKSPNLNEVSFGGLPTSMHEVPQDGLYLMIRMQIFCSFRAKECQLKIRDGGLEVLHPLLLVCLLLLVGALACLAILRHGCGVRAHAGPWSRV